VDGSDPTGLENWAASRDYATATIEHDSHTEDHYAMRDRQIERRRIEDKDIGITIRDVLI